MKNKKVVPIIVIIIIIGIIVSVRSAFMLHNNCDTLDNRELLLRGIDGLGEATTIDHEIVIDEYIISGYVTKNSRYGLALFAPTGNGNYEFQRNINRDNDSLIFFTSNINDQYYHFFWANKANLDYAEITYTIDGEVGETLKLDASDNKIIFIEGSPRDFSCEYFFIDKNGNRYG